MQQKESHTNFTDCQKGILMLYSLPSDSVAIMFHNQPTETKLALTLTVTARNKMRQEAAFVPYRIMLYGCIIEHQSPNVSRNKTEEASVSRQTFRI